MHRHQILRLIANVVLLSAVGWGQQVVQMPGGKPPDGPVDAVLRGQVLESLEKELDGKYIFPDTARKVVAALRDHAAKKDYDAITTAQEFAKRLTDDMQAVAHDRHLRVFYGREFHAGPPTPEMKERMTEMARTVNFGFQAVERLPGNIGYLDLRAFMEAPEAGDVAAGAMAVLANCDAVIFDLRKNGGGSPEMIDLLISYLYPRGERVHLNDFIQRGTDEREQYWTFPWVPGKTLAGKDVYVLTSNRTFSAAEEFTYDIQTQKRGTIVGEVTGGGANPGDGVPLADRFSAFIPSGSAYNPITKTNWEGVGIKPDVAIAADDALKAAQLLALRKLAKKDGPPPWKIEVTNTLEQLEKEIGPKITAAAGQ